MAKNQEPLSVPPRSYLKWLAVDLDETLAEGVWTPENPTSAIGPPIWKNVRKAEKKVAEGFKIVIHTSRPWHDYEAIETWLNHWNIPWSHIVCGKLLAGGYADDRNIDIYEEEWTIRSKDAGPD